VSACAIIRSLTRWQILCYFPIYIISFAVLCLTPLVHCIFPRFWTHDQPRTGFRFFPNCAKTAVNCQTLPRSGPLNGRTESRGFTIAQIYIIFSLQPGTFIILRRRGQPLSTVSLKKLTVLIWHSLVHPLAKPSFTA
jgi:hypothetical protein